MKPIVRFLLLLIVVTATALNAQVPDLTNGGVPTSLYRINLGPTGLAGWVYAERINFADGETTNARQFLITGVDPGSPADGVVAVNDVILGASGTGATPANFTYDARQALATAINDAEARNPAILKVLRWRAGSTAVVNLTLQSLGSYAATASYDLRKSKCILNQVCAEWIKRHLVRRSHPHRRIAVSRQTQDHEGADPVPRCHGFEPLGQAGSHPDCDTVLEFCGEAAKPVLSLMRQMANNLKVRRKAVQLKSSIDSLENLIQLIE